LGILADAGRGVVMGAACPPTCFVLVAFSDMPVLGTTMMTDNGRWCVTRENGREIG
jgi:hypothetical protein